jgi:3'5'-cyclic nucleotide phosphodiesterase
VIFQVCELLLEPMKKIIVLRNHKAGYDTYEDARYHDCGCIPIEEVAEVIVLPDFNARKAAERANYKSIELREEIMEQLKSYVTSIAATYRDNPFHNFEHACHVTMSVSKLMNRIVTPDIDPNDVDGNGLESQLHDYTYGINSDPLALLAIILSALIHDTDHRGISNMQLCKEDPALAQVYKSQSVAEQNSLDIAWRILMDDQYSKLRGCLFSNQSDMDHFRQVMVNVGKFIKTEPSLNVLWITTLKLLFINLFSSGNRHIRQRT